jgi:hypothetical protein
MAQEPKEYSNLAVLPETKRKIQLLAKIKGDNILELIAAWADEAWEKSKKEGLVNDAMIQTQSPSKQKKTVGARVAALVA